MGAMSGIKAVFGLSGSGVPTKTNVSGTQRLGVSQTDVAISSATKFYSFKVDADDVSDIATLTLGTGTVVASGGSTPTITDGDGKDFEGVSLGSITKIYAILIEVTVGGPDLVIELDGVEIESPLFQGESRKVELIFPSGFDITSETMVFTWGSTPAVSGDSVTVTIAGS